MKFKQIHEIIMKSFFVIFLVVAMLFPCVGCASTCIHYDMDGNSKCDECGEGYTKKIIFIGNSHTYYGQTVLEKSQTYLTQKERTGDQGYFYQLCRDNGMDIEVTNWTFGNHSINSLFGGNCSANRGCDGEDHKAYLTDKAFDYVVIQPGSGAKADESFLTDMETVMNFFSKANPHTKFVMLAPHTFYGTIGSTIHLSKNILNNLKTVEAKGVKVVDWGGLVMNLINGSVKVPESAIEYTKNTFIISKSPADGYHPNQLTGYITTLMTYCAITGESAVGKAYAFCNDPSLRPEGASEKFFSFSKFKKTYYTTLGATTNYPDVFASQIDMQGLQTLVDEHLEAKAYLNYNY